MKHWREECAVFGAWGDPESSQMTYLGLYAQQHRGQESTGIVSLFEGQHITHKGLGLVGKVYKEDDLKRLKGDGSIGHVRYSTMGDNYLENAQPLTATLTYGPIAIAHNGNIINANALREELISDGAIFQGTNDTEVLLHLLARNPKGNFRESLKHSLSRLEGAFSIVILTSKGLVAARDPLGFRPLVLGRRSLDNGKKSIVVASETCAFDLIGAEYEREINPGEIYWVTDEGEGSELFSENPKKAQCIFEHVYFSRPDSVVFGKNVYETRKQMGRCLAKEASVNADLVIPVPDSGVPAAIGYSQESGLPFEFGIIRNHYVGRTFIQPSQSIRSFGVKVKLNPQAEVLKGKSVVVIDDSIVRGTTSKKIIQLIRNAGAKEIHFKVASPPTTGSCYYGVDTPRRKQLIASEKSLDGIREFIGADTLSYLSMDGMLEAVSGDKNKFCAACFDGEYPTKLYNK